MSGKSKHGDSNGLTPLYNAWRNMKARCLNPNMTQFKDWGGRGITVCDAWKNDYPTFKAWAITHGYREGLSLDRIDNDGAYAPENCRWITTKQSCRNRRTNKLVQAFGELKSLVEWSEDERCHASADTLNHRLRTGCPPERAIERAVVR